jgi:hypothetical protein
MFDVLEALEWGMKHFDGYAARAGTEMKYLLKAVEQGYAESIGFVYQADGDGFLLENRMLREAWRLTACGIHKLEEFRKSVDGGSYPVK